MAKKKELLSSYLLSNASFIVNHIKNSGIANNINIIFSKPVKFFILFPL